MADLTITATQVLPSTGAQYVDGTAGVAVTAGQPCYVNASNQMVLADCDASAAAANARGIATHGAAAGQPLRLQHKGKMILGAGAAPVAGTIYVVSDTAGGIKPAADLVTGDNVTVLGIGCPSNAIDLDALYASGVAVP